jgi:hypothetical protein
MATTTTMSLDKAYQMKAYYKSVAESVNKAFANTGQQIEDIVVSPCDVFNQWYFFNFFLECRDNEEALKFYTHKDYCVVAIIREMKESDEVQYSYKSLEDMQL